MNAKVSVLCTTDSSSKEPIPSLNKVRNIKFFLKFLATFVAPPMSFINVADFRSAKELANYLLYLDSHDGIVE